MFEFLMDWQSLLGIIWSIFKIYKRDGVVFVVFFLNQYLFLTSLFWEDCKISKQNVFKIMSSVQCVDASNWTW